MSTLKVGIKPNKDAERVVYSATYETPAVTSLPAEILQKIVGRYFRDSAAQLTRQAVMSESSTIETNKALLQKSVELLTAAGVPEAEKFALTFCQKSDPNFHLSPQLSYTWGNDVILERLDAKRGRPAQGAGNSTSTESTSEESENEVDEDDNQ